MTSQEPSISNTVDETLPTALVAAPQDAASGSANTSGGIRLAGVLAGMGSGIHSPPQLDSVSNVNSKLLLYCF